MSVIRDGLEWNCGRILGILRSTIRVLANLRRQAVDEHFDFRLPDGTVEEFDFVPTPSSQAFLPPVPDAVYVPRPGTKGDLSITG